jgi:hypothetical protein
MASIAMRGDRPFRGGLFFCLPKAEAEEPLALLRRASMFPRRARRIPPSTSDAAVRPGWSWSEREIHAEQGTPFHDLPQNSVSVVFL